MPDIVFTKKLSVHLYSKKLSVHLYFQVVGAIISLVYYQTWFLMKRLINKIVNS